MHRTRAPRLFQTYVAADWSAASTPKRGKDSIWVAVSRGGRDTVENVATRDAATERARQLLREAVARGERVLVGFDFPYGYPMGVADVVAPGAAPGWRRLWDAIAALVRDDARNRSNRFEVAAALNARMGPPGPFWGCPVGAATEALLPTKGTFPHCGRIEEFRRIERVLHSRRQYPKSVWQLAYSGSVGSQALVGIPRLAALRDDPELAPVSVVWPFETGFGVAAPDDAPLVVHAEIWPAAFAVDRGAHPVADAAQVLAVVRRFAALDEAGELGDLFERPRRLHDEDGASLEEGWILGVT